MLFEFLQGMLLGFGAAVPLGPINILIMNEALRKYSNAVAVGFGALCADTTYLTIILFGLTFYLTNSIVLSTLSYLGAFFLLFMAYLIFQSKERSVKTIKLEKKKSLFTCYVKGYILTLLSPYTIIFWISVSTFSTQSKTPLVIVGGMLFAILIWIVLMPYFIFKTKHFVSQKLYSTIAVISAFIMVFFAFLMIAKSFI